MVLSKAITAFQQVQMRHASTVKSASPNDFRYFTIKGMKKNVAVIPLVVIMAGAVVGLTGFIIFSFCSRTDIYLDRSKPSIGESMDMMNPKVTKLYIARQEYHPMPELAAALKAREE